MYENTGIIAYVFWELLTSLFFKGIINASQKRTRNSIFVAVCFGYIILGKGTEKGECTCEPDDEMKKCVSAVGVRGWYSEKSFFSLLFFFYTENVYGIFWRAEYTKSQNSIDVCTPLP